VNYSNLAVTSDLKNYLFQIFVFLECYAVFPDCSTLEDGIVSLSRNVGN